LFLYFFLLFLPNLFISATVFETTGQNLWSQFPSSVKEVYCRE